MSSSFPWRTNEYSQFALLLRPDNARQTRLFYGSPPHTCWIDIVCREILWFLRYLGYICHPASAVFLTKCRLIAVRKRYPASRLSPPDITHTPVCQQSATIDPLRTRCEAISPSHRPTGNHSVSPTLPHGDRVELDPTTDFA